MFGWLARALYRLATADCDLALASAAGVDTLAAFQARRVLISGASKGIGAELARQIAGLVRANRRRSDP